MEAHVLSLNDFSRPKVFNKADAEYVNIVYLMLLNKGTYQSHPNMGLGIRERYRFDNSENLLNDLRNDIRNQLTQFLPTINVTNVETILKDKTLGVIIYTISGVYVVAYDSDKDVIDVAADYILDDL